VRRSDPVRGRTGLLATIGPIAVGVMLAFAWNLAVSQRHAAVDESGVTQQTGQHAASHTAQSPKGTRQGRSG
jgi:hypothetical protein